MAKMADNPKDIGGGFWPLSDIKMSFQIKGLILSFFSALALVLRFAFEIPIADAVFKAIFFWLIVVLFLMEFSSRQKRFTKALETIHFCFYVLELFILTVIVHWLGGGGWIGVIFYTLFCVYGVFLFSEKIGFLIVFLSFFSYALLLFLEGFGIIRRQPFMESQRALGDPSYFLTTIAFSAGLFFFIGLGTNLFARRLRQRTEELAKLSDNLKEAKEVLEVRVGARTRELEELNRNLDERVKERTRELEESKKELQEKLRELEAVHKLMVGREIKMVELKKEIGELKGKKS